VGYYGAHQNDDLVKKLEDYDNQVAAQQIADRDLRKNTLTRRSGGAVVAMPGKSLGNLDEALKASVQNEINITIAGDDVKVDQDTGTRAPKVMVRRSSGAN
jgi:hypothetical protein